MPVVIVTGGTYGIGAAISLTLAARGHDVVAFGLDRPQPGSTAADGTARLQAAARERGVALETLDADVADAAQVRRVVDFTLARFGRIDALVNNAAIAPLGTILDTPEALWDRVIATNLKGPYLCAKAVLPHMIAAGGGAIVNVGSGAGWGKPDMCAYAASKGGVFALGAALAYDYFHDRIRVNTVCPGGGGIVTGQSEFRAKHDTAGAPAARGTAAGRPATGDDVAHAVAFLLSREGEAISGAIVDVGTFAHQGGPIPARPAGTVR